MRRLLAALTLVALAACGDNSTTQPTTVNLVGSWKLQSVNGSALPYTQTTSTGTVEIFDGQIVIGTSGDFTTTLTQRVTTDGSSSISVVTTRGTVVIDGASVVLKNEEIQNDPGTQVALTADALAFVQNGLTLVFVKT